MAFYKGAGFFMTNIAGIDNKNSRDIWKQIGNIFNLRERKVQSVNITGPEAF